MKNTIMKISDRLLLRKRGIIETDNDKLKNIALMEKSSHRPFDNFIVNTIGALTTYYFFPKKTTSSKDNRHWSNSSISRYLFQKAN